MFYVLFTYYTICIIYKPLFNYSIQNYSDMNIITNKKVMYYAISAHPGYQDDLDPVPCMHILRFLSTPLK